MPVPEIERLNTSSSDSQTKAAISACIQMMMNEGRPQDQAVAMCQEMVRGKKGQASEPKGGK